MFGGYHVDSFALMGKAFDIDEAKYGVKARLSSAFSIL